MENLSVEIRVPVSPTPEFALMISVLSCSLRRYSNIPDLRIQAYIGAPSSDLVATETLAEWLTPEISPVIVDSAKFDARSFHATGAARLTQRSNADVVILMDADTVVCGDLLDICKQTLSLPSISGVIAHVAPLSQLDWHRAFSEIGAVPQFPFRYTGWPYMFPSKGIPLSPSLAAAPAYFNFGFIATTKELLEQVGGHFDRCFDIVERLFPGLMFNSQMALTLAAADAGVPSRSLPMRYNFPNDFRLEALHPEQLRQARIIHLLRRSQGVDKYELYREVEALRAFVADAWRWAGAAARARNVVQEVLAEVEEKGVPDGLAQPSWAW